MKSWRLLVPLVFLINDYIQELVRQAARARITRWRHLLPWADRIETSCLSEVNVMDTVTRETGLGIWKSTGQSGECRAAEDVDKTPYRSPTTACVTKRSVMPRFKRSPTYTRAGYLRYADGWPNLICWSLQTRTPFRPPRSSSSLPSRPVPIHHSAASFSRSAIAPARRPGLTDIRSSRRQ